MTDFQKAITDMVESAKDSADILPVDYAKDGLLHCGKCHTPKQCRVNLLGREMTVFCLCKCRAETLEVEEEARREWERKERIKRLRTEGIQDEAIRRWTFANDDNSNPAMMDKAMRYFAKWEQMFKQNMGLLLWGNVGTGKTYFAACIANALLESGVPVLMTNFAKIINAMSGFVIEDKNAYLQMFNKYDLLIIDDLGAERQSEFAQEIVYNVIDTRYKKNKPLIITTNMTLDEIKNPKNTTYSRIYDRIIEMCVPIHFAGGSRRKEAFKSRMEQAKAIFGNNGCEVKKGPFNNYDSTTNTDYAEIQQQLQDKLYGD